MSLTAATISAVFGVFPEGPTASQLTEFTQQAALPSTITINNETKATNDSTDLNQKASDKSFDTVECFTP